MPPLIRGGGIIWCAEGRHNMPAFCKLTFDLESGVRVPCDVGYLCVNFSLPGPLCSRLRPDVRDRHTSDVRRASSLNASFCPMGAGAYNNNNNNTHNQHVLSLRIVIM